MDEKKQANLKIMGSSTTGGGTFHKVKVLGECQAAGDIECETFRVMGTCRVLGGLKTLFFRNLGEVTVKGSLQTDEMRILGTTEVDMDCRAKKARISGELSCLKDFYGEEAKIRGSLVVHGNAETESIKVWGWITVEGMMNSGVIDIVLRHGAENRAGEIGAGTIRIKRRRPLFGLSPGGHFKADVIEGDDIYLEHTTASVVRGSRVVIGPGCAIGAVEYKDSYKAKRGSKIGRIEKFVSVNENGQK